ncbi:MAG: glycogen debranching enzyme N-terminal domain-containing protein [Methanotrichaceae archaeon]|nr:glycogen debranching enzyme N-terminal domain-containing protein [Methanotrichaceae archaeon]
MEARFKPANYESEKRREWLIANGLGGYASSTALGANTRAYHGLLVAALDPPTDRRLLLSSLDEELNGYELANHQYPGIIYPQGFRFLKEFRLDPFPLFIYELEEGLVEKNIFMIHGENTTLVHYRIKGIQGRIRITPLVHCRSFHAVSPLLDIGQYPLQRGTFLKSDCRLILLSDEAEFRPKELTFYNFEYDIERERGLPWREDLFSPGYFEKELEGNDTFCIMASTWRTSMPSVEEALVKEIFRLKAITTPVPELSQAADSFLVRRGSTKTIIAGYHWFDDWGRDAMIALPGLLLATGRFEDAKLVLKAFASGMKNGVLPNDFGATSFNTVDASLWFIKAIGSYYDYSQDLDFIGLLWPKLLEVIRRYSGKGEDFGMDVDGLIISGPQFTWMDARVDGVPVTPRAGKACEINALWYKSLKIMEGFAQALKEPWDPSLINKVKKSFQKFWNPENGCLFDVLDPEDASVRPNQIVAAAIPDLLPAIKRRGILEVVTRDLLTPYGLRTLSPRDPRYIPKYEGGPKQRDAAYHQGTVWPWLMGYYVEAMLAIDDSSDDYRELASEVLQALIKLDIGGFNTIPEVFDGDSPHRPGGCISQAWSVAEVIRAWTLIKE